MAEANSSSPQDQAVGTAQQLPASSSTSSVPVPFPLPRVTIRFCTQCKWMLRAAYFAQELLSTFSTALGEVALQPSTGGTFVVTIEYHPQQPSSSSAPDTIPAAPAPSLLTRTLWDRKIDGGFPETKELKRRVRDVIEPGRDLGHVDRDHKRPPTSQSETKKAEEPAATTTMASSQDNNKKDGSTAAPAPPLGPRWPDSSSAPATQQSSSSSGNPDKLRRGHSKPMMPADDDNDNNNNNNSSVGAAAGISTTTNPLDSRSWKDLAPHPNVNDGPGDQPAGDVYHSRMAGGGNMPVVRPPGEAANAAARARMEAQRREGGESCAAGEGEKCEDCE